MVLRADCKQGDAPIATAHLRPMRDEAPEGEEGDGMAEAEVTPVQHWNLELCECGHTVELHRRPFRPLAAGPAKCRRGFCSCPMFEATTRPATLGSDRVSA